MGSSGHFNPANGDVELRSSYGDKDEIKRLGAKYDGARRSWFVPSGMSLEPFSKWLPSDRLYSAVSLKFPCVYLVFATYNGHFCGKPTTVGGFGIPFDSKIVLTALDGGARLGSGLIDISTTTPDMLAIIPHLDCTPREMRDVLEERCKYTPAYSNVLRTTRLRNVCANCGKLVGDNYVFDDNGSPLNPMSPDEVDKISFLRFDIDASCGIYCPPEYLDTEDSIGHLLMLKAAASGDRYRRKLYEVIHFGCLMDDDSACADV